MIYNYDTIDELKSVIKKCYVEQNYELAVTKGLNLLNKALQTRFRLNLSGPKLIDEIIKDDNLEVIFNNIYSNLNNGVIKEILLYLKSLYINEETHHSKPFKLLSKDDADMILTNINYVLKKISVIKEDFVVDEFMKYISHPSFPVGFEDEEYIIKSVPIEDRVEIAINIIKIIKDETVNNYRSFFFNLMDTLNIRQIKLVNKHIIDKLYSTLGIIIFDDNLNQFMGECFKYLDDDFKIQFEASAFEDFVKAVHDENNTVDKDGLLVSFLSVTFFVHFDKKKWTDELIRKLSSSKKERDFTQKYMFYKIARINYNDTEESLLNYMIEKYEENDSFVVDYLHSIQFNDKNHPWYKIIST